MFHLATLQLQQVLNRRVKDLVIPLIKEYVNLLEKLQHFCVLCKQFFKSYKGNTLVNSAKKWKYLKSRIPLMAVCTVSINPLSSLLLLLVS